MSPATSMAADKLVEQAKADRKKRITDSNKDISQASKEIASGMIGIAHGRHKTPLPQDLNCVNGNWIPPADPVMIEQYNEAISKITELSSRIGTLADKSEIKRCHEIINKFRPSLIKSGIIQQEESNVN